MQKIVILGTGNVATHLFAAFDQTKDCEVIQIYNRSSRGLKPFAHKTANTTTIKNIKPADVYIVSVSDDAVQGVVEKLASNHRGLIVHTTGSVPLLSCGEHNGVFYPLQTFSKNTRVDFSHIPICVEADTEEATETLEKLGHLISRQVYRISTDQRKTLHLAAVFGCNFTNHLYRLAEKICQKDHIPFAIMHPLIEETAHKATLNSPKDAQTGPAIRGDQETINFHLKHIESMEMKEIYTLLTQSIQREDGSELQNNPSSD